MCKRIFSVPGGNTPKKNPFQFPLTERLIAETMFSRQKFEWVLFPGAYILQCHFLEENILGINEGIFKLLDSLIKKVFLK